MLTSLAFVFLGGLLAAALCRALKLPGLVGMLLTGVLAVTSMGCAFKRKSVPAVSDRLSDKFAKLWLAAELILFVLVGAAADIRYTLHAGFPAIAMILSALLFRAAGVLLCLVGTPLSPRERLFCIIAYMPKATVQAAIGSVPLALGLPCGASILSVSVLGILLTAAPGAIGIDQCAKRLLQKPPAPGNPPEA